MKAVAMFSGGLDSILAIRIIQEAGVDVEAVHFIIPFLNDYHHLRQHEQRIRDSVSQLGVPLHLIHLGDPFLRMIEKPRFGYGKNMNPCIDCRIYLLVQARKLMEEIGASFLVTGEVLGQRPKSQHEAAFHIAEREAGLRGLIVRPLSAHRLSPTIPETEGWIDRNKLLGIAGRGRNQQMELAARWNLKYPSPAGGCLLTVSDYSRRLSEMLKDTGILKMPDVKLLRWGRHFRLGPGVKAVVGRDRHENLALMWLYRSLPEPKAILQLKEVKGPLTVVTGDATLKQLESAARLTARYTGLAPEQTVNLKGLSNGRNRMSVGPVQPFSPGDADKMRIQ